MAENETPNAGLSDDAKWQVYATYLSNEYFKDEQRPAAHALIRLLRSDLGVDLAKVEALVEELVSDG